MHLNTIRPLINFSFPIVLLVAALSVSPASAQSLDAARTFPPSSFKKDVSEINLQSLAWKIRLEQSLTDEYRNSRDLINEDMKAVSGEIEKLTEELPIEFRFLDAGARASLASKLSERILDLKLDIATQEKMLNFASDDVKAKQGDLEHQLAKQDAQLQIRAAELDVKHKEQKLENSKQLTQKKFVSESQYLEDKFQLDLAKLKLERAMLSLATLSDVDDSKNAKQKAELRQKIQPLQAQLSVAEEQLASLADASSTILKIDSLKRKLDLMTRDLEVVAGGLIEHSQAQLELEVLRDAIKAELEKEQE